MTPAPLAIVSSCLLARIRKGVEDREGSAMSVYRKLEGDYSYYSLKMRKNEINSLCHIPNVLLQGQTVHDKDCTTGRVLVLVHKTASKSFVSRNIDQSSIALRMEIRGVGNCFKYIRRWFLGHYVTD